MPLAQLFKRGCPPFKRFTQTSESQVVCLDETMEPFFLRNLAFKPNGRKRTPARPRAQRQTCASNQVAGPRVCPDAGVHALGPAAGPPAAGPSHQQQCCLHGLHVARRTYNSEMRGNSHAYGVNSPFASKFLGRVRWRRRVVAGRGIHRASAETARAQYAPWEMQRRAFVSPGTNNVSAVRVRAREIARRLAREQQLYSTGSGEEG